MFFSDVSPYLPRLPHALTPHQPQNQSHVFFLIHFLYCLLYVLLNYTLFTFLAFEHHRHGVTRRNGIHLWLASHSVLFWRVIYAHGYCSLTWHCSLAFCCVKIPRFYFSLLPVIGIRLFPFVGLVAFVFIFYHVYWCDHFLPSFSLWNVH